MSDQPKDPRGDAIIDFGKLAAEVMVEHFHDDVKARLDAHGADAFELAAKEVEEHGAFQLTAWPGMPGHQMVKRLAARLREVAKDLRR